MIRDQFVTEEQLAAGREAYRNTRQRGIDIRPTLPPDRYPISDKLRWQYDFSLLQVSYSIGDSVADVAQAVAKVTAELPDVERVSKGFSEATHYERVLWLLSMAVLVDDHDSIKIIEGLASDIGFTDDLYARLFGHPDPKVGTVYAEIKSHDGLVEAARLAESGDSKAASERLTKYVESEWYRGRSGAPWYGLDKRSPELHVGYWAYEAAAIAKVCGIDDSALEGHKYYPWDLAHH